jgi:heavy metal sensor kinase
MAPELAILRELATNFFWMIVVALIVGAGVGYLLVGAALAPIQHATSTALTITRTGRLDRRIPITSNREDEITTLISTFNEMLDRLQELFEKQRRFSGDISHELRTPLTTILGNISLLKRASSLPEAEKQEMLDEIEAEAQRMKRLIADLLLLAQEDADMVMRHEPVELDTLMLEVYRQIKRHADKVDIEIVHEDQAVVLGDADRLRQLLVNLLNNAVQYTPAGGKIELSLDRRGDKAEITVRDTGQGIAPEDLPHIFDRFYRADKARSRTKGGSGLGLSIVRWVVDAHHGEIEVESTPGQGTTFRVRLPLLRT